MSLRKANIEFGCGTKSRSITQDGTGRVRNKCIAAVEDAVGRKEFEFCRGVDETCVRFGKSQSEGRLHFALCECHALSGLRKGEAQSGEKFCLSTFKARSRLLQGRCQSRGESVRQVIEALSGPIHTIAEGRREGRLIFL